MNKQAGIPMISIFVLCILFAGSFHFMRRDKIATPYVITDKNSMLEYNVDSFTVNSTNGCISFLIRGARDSSRICGEFVIKRKK